MRDKFTTIGGTAPRTAPAHLTQIDLADRWRLSPRTLEKWRSLGVGPAFIRVGGAIRYRMEDVLAYEASSLRGGPR